jgi:phospholipid/cholesterol/gamma-HCH transport system substrate-binding protein
MKVSNETKVGALTVVAVTLLVLGYNFLKGKNLVKRSDVIYARFADVGPLEISSPVKIKGYRIGNVYSFTASDENVTDVIVAINLDKKVNIPVNSLAVINSNITGGATLAILPGNSTNYVKEGDTLKSSANPDLLTKLGSNVDPVLTNLNHAVDSLRMVLGNLNSVFDQGNKDNLKAVLANLKTSTDNLSVLLNSKDGALAKTLKNAETFTTNLNGNNEKLNSTIDNLKNTSQKLSDLQLKETVANLNNTITQLQTILQKANKGEGTLGLLVNDSKLYNNLQNTSRSLNILLDDLRLNPKRYINVSVFGKKDKNQPLMQPLADSSKNK